MGHPIDAMVALPGGEFRMGDARFYREEGPVRRVAVDGFRIDPTPVTVAAFAAFVEATGYVTLAERPLDRDQYPDADPELLVPGALVFHRTEGPVDLRQVRNWWSYLPGASWRRPEGPGSDVNGREQHPVTQVAWEDAAAYAAWAGTDLPTEAEWEYAARGGLDGAVYTWGDEFAPGGRPMANTWQGQFPWENTLDDGWELTSSVGSFDPNGFGLFDMAGNVWEWTRDLYSRSPEGSGEAAAKRGATEGAADGGQGQHDEEHPCCVPSSPGPATIPRRVTKGGSHLCAPSYCLRYRPAARQGEAVDTSTSHIGFRCVIRDGAAA
jgi:sulfatase modifying factor 1